MKLAPACRWRETFEDDGWVSFKKVFCFFHSALEWLDTYIREYIEAAFPAYTD